MLCSTFVQKAQVNRDPCLNNPNCIKGVGKVPLLNNVRQTLIDPDTPDSAKTKIAADGKTKLELVVWQRSMSPTRSKRSQCLVLRRVQYGWPNILPW